MIYVLNKSLETVGIIEDYYSLIWSERYSSVGDFELDLPISYDDADFIAFGNFLKIQDSDRLMIIEDIKPQTTEDNTSLIIRGESAESILKRRITLAPIHISAIADSAIYALLTTHMISPSDSNRQIDIFKATFPPSSIVTVVSEIFEIDTLYNIVASICLNTSLGFKIVIEDQQLAFSVYEGVDRSYDQIVNTYVIFSDNFDNVISSSFYESEKDKVNGVYVTTDDPVSELQKVFIYLNPLDIPSDLDRYETSLETTIDRDIDGADLTDEEVLAIITTRGRNVILEHNTVGLFEGEFDIQGSFEYGIDFFLGDVVQCKIENR